MMFPRCRLLAMALVFVVMLVPVSAMAQAIWDVQPAGEVLRISEPPRIDGDDPMADPVWQEASLVGSLVSRGQPEPAGRETEIRLLVCDATLFVGVICHDPHPEAIVRTPPEGRLWETDSVEWILTQQDQANYPYLSILVTVSGQVELTRYLRAGIRGNPASVTEPMDPALIQARTGMGHGGWWAVMGLPMKVLGLPGDGFYGNVVRNMPRDGSDYAWHDIWGGWVQLPERMGRFDVVDRLSSPGPVLALPASLAVGRNALTLEHWSAGYTFTLNQQPVAVSPAGQATMIIARHGTASFEINDPRGKTVGRYTAEVLRPLTIEADEPFVTSLTNPIKLKVNLRTTAPATVVVTATQNDKTVGQLTRQITPGETNLSVACSDLVPGEVWLSAVVTLQVDPDASITVAADHWCVVGKAMGEFDAFRDGIGELETRSMFRAGLADACGLYRLLQAGDGRCRSMSRWGRLSFSDWSYGACYPFALLYKSDWPENPYKGDRRFLVAAAAGMEAGLDPARWYEFLEHPMNRQIQGYLLTYDLIKDDVSAAQAQYWQRRLTELIDATIMRWLVPASYKTSRFSEQTGTGTNHFAYHTANVYTAGLIMNRPDWVERGSKEMRILAAHEHDGQFPERWQVPASHYTWLTMNALGEYYWQSKDDLVLSHLMRCITYGCHTSLPNGDTTLLHDGRVNSAHPYLYGDFVLSLTPQGRHMARIRAMQRINPSRKPSQSSPEYWFRTAENALYFQPGPEEALPDPTEFVFLDGRGLIARRQGFVYGLNAIAELPMGVRNYWVDPQNTVELYHATAGSILCAANSQNQPEAGSFHRYVNGRASFMPVTGSIEYTEIGHQAILEYDTFTVRLEVEVLSPTAARVTVRLFSAIGDEPVIYSFFPAVRRADELKVDTAAGKLTFQGVTLAVNRPIDLDREFRIVNPYSLQKNDAVKPVRVWTKLEKLKPFVIDVTIAP